MTASAVEKKSKWIAMVAMDPNRLIGSQGQLPWHLPEDLKLFKRETSGHAIVMGRKTFESIGRPLPKRRNIVLTRERQWQAEGAEVVHTLEELQELLLGEEKSVFIIGGAEIYALCLPLTDELWISHLRESYPGDTYFPEFQQAFPHEVVMEAFEEFDWKRHTRTL